jgi:hypothetical protein
MSITIDYHKNGVYAAFDNKSKKYEVISSNLYEIPKILRQKGYNQIEYSPVVIELLFGEWQFMNGKRIPIDKEVENV